MHKYLVVPGAFPRVDVSVADLEEVPEIHAEPDVVQHAIGILVIDFILLKRERSRYIPKTEVSRMNTRKQANSKKERRRGPNTEIRGMHCQRVFLSRNILRAV